MTTNDVILRFPRDIKIQCLKDALAQDEFGIFMGLSMILLDTPVPQGGLDTELIDAIYNEHLVQHGIKPI